jgi:phosphate starvation-inducible PhoH-like protein
VVILDESQNCTTRQLKTFLTRLSHNAKLIILGDPEQSDIRPTQNEYASDLEFIADRLDGIPGCAIVDFEPSDSVRHPLVNRMLARLS